MSTQYKASNVDEAIAIANELKRKGKYDWFRGQVSLRPPYSSFFRLNGSKERINAARKQHKQFFEWLKLRPELKHLNSMNHDPWAILQHYGIPTNYIDFTTDPSIAGFFACDTDRPPGEMSCIYCLDSDDAIRLWKMLKSATQPGMIIEKVVIDVNNLWRLQSQKGVFLHCNFNWDVEYPMDRIVFRREGRPLSPDRSLVYPIHKSPLELVLDQYFQLDEQTEKIEMLKQEMGRIAELKVIDLGIEIDGYHNPAFRNEMNTLDSWASEEIQKWLVENVEIFQMPTLIQIDLAGSEIPAEVGARIRSAISERLITLPGIRQQTVEFHIVNLNSELQVSLVNILRILWNGMRNLPFSSEDILVCMERSAALLAETMICDERSGEEMVRSHIPDLLKVGFAYSDGSGSLSYVSLSSLRKAVRPDLMESISDEYKKYIHAVEDVFPFLCRPWRMFDFKLFCELFARDVIPVQVVFPVGKLTVFNPAKLITFGLANRF